MCIVTTFCNSSFVGREEVIRPGTKILLCMFRL